MGRISYTGRPTPRKPPVRPSNASVALFCGFMALVLLASLVFGLTRDLPSKQAQVEPKVTHDSLGPTYTHDGEIIRWYVFTDPDTGIQYLVSDRGGCCPRLDEYGNIMGVRPQEDYE